MPPSPRSPPWPLLRAHAPRLAALGLALVHAALALAIAGAPIFAKYPALAARLQAGQLTAAQVSDASPAYLLLHLALPPEVIRLLQIAVAAAAVYLVARVGARLAGPAIGLAAAAALAFAEPWLLYPSVLEPDLLIGALNLAAVASLLLLGMRPRAAALAGALLGLSVALRPTAALLALVALAWIVAQGRKEGRSIRRAVAFGLALALAAGAPAFALGIRSGSLRERGSSMSAGAVLHLGNRPEGSGLGANYPTLLKLVELQSVARSDRTPDHAHELYRTFASAAEGRPLGAPEAERYWMGKVLAFAHDEPGAVLRLLARKLAFAVAAPPDDHDIPEVQRAALERRLPALSLRVLALAGAGGLLLVARRRGASRLVAGWAAAYLAVFVAFYYGSRYALAILPAWALLAAAGAAAFREAARDSRGLVARAALAAAPLLLLALPSVRHEGRFQERRLLVPLRSEAVALRNEGRWAEALDRFLDEQAAFPDLVWPWSTNGFGLDADSAEHALGAAERARRRFGEGDPVDAYLLAVLYAGGGRCDAALPLLDRASAAGVSGAVADRALDPDLLASDCLLDLGQPGEALARVRRSLARRPGTLDGLARATAAALARPGLATEAERSRWEASLARLHDPSSVRWALSREHLRWGDPARALASADALRASLPAAAPFAEFERARALAELGRPAEALQAYARALELRSPMHGAARLDPLVRALDTAAPGGAARALALAHWMRRGQHDAVRALLAKDREATRTAPREGAPAGRDAPERQPAP